MKSITRRSYTVQKIAIHYVFINEVSKNQTCVFCLKHRFVYVNKNVQENYLGQLPYTEKQNKTKKNSRTKKTEIFSIVLLLLLFFCVCVCLCTTWEEFEKKKKPSLTTLQRNLNV